MAVARGRKKGKIQIEIARFDTTNDPSGWKLIDVK
jgi:hypothetical protein